jgi:cytochrome c peroxidase
VASPTVLNSAYQDVMLWNGQFGNSAAGSVNAGIAPSLLMTPDTPKAENGRQLQGLETQAIAGIGVHRLQVEPGSVIQTVPAYRALWRAAYGEQSTDVVMDAGKAIAAYERSVLANNSPFQLWLRGDNSALSKVELQGAELFFGKAGCVGCHQGPALSSAQQATADEMFYATGFADLDTSDMRIHGSVNDATSKGRGGFTNNPDDDYRFKIPQLYNLADTTVFGHGASFDSIRAVVEYKNAAMAQSAAAESALDSRFRPLALFDAEIDHLTAFLSSALRDPGLARYEPETVPSGACVTVDAFSLMPDARCSDDGQS